MRNHGTPITVGYSDTPSALFAVATRTDLNVPQEGVLDFSLRDVFDVPDLNTVNDDIVNGVANARPEWRAGSGALHGAAD